MQPKLRRLVMPLLLTLAASELVSAQVEAASPVGMAKHALCQVTESTGFGTTGWLFASVQERGFYRNFVLTNAHLVHLHGEQYVDSYSILHGGRKYRAHRCGYVSGATPDLACFRFDTGYPCRTLKLADTTPQAGAFVQTLGYPYFTNDRTPLFSAGQVVQKVASHRIVATFKSESGQSGSPVVNNQGQVVGIVFAKDREFGPGNGLFCGLTPIRTFLATLVQRGALPRGYSSAPFT